MVLGVLTEMILQRPEIEELSRARVLCIGDVMLDRFIYGETERISPEAPVPVLRVSHAEVMPGGAGNVARNIGALGAQCFLLTVIGKDTAGRELKSLLKRLPNLVYRAVEDQTRQTTVKSRFVASNQQVLRVDREVGSFISDDIADILIDEAMQFLRGVDVVVLSDYAKGVLTQKVCCEIIHAARGAEIPVIADPKGKDFRKYVGASVVTPNLRELQIATGIEGNSDDIVERSANELLRRVEVDGILVTRSERGVSYVRRDEQAVHFHSTARDVYDVSGAGDTVIATMAVAMGAGLATPHAAELANFAGGIVVGKANTATVQHRELLAASRQHERGSLLHKIFELDELDALAQSWRDERCTIGFTNGCFDLIHPGHISLLSQAAAQCNRLVVGLNSDASVLRLKGPGRPIQDELSRALVLGALPYVDAILIFDEDTPELLVKKLRPDVLIKGADYKPSDVIGADFVRSYGGTLFLADLTPNQSTTGMVQRLID